MKKPGFVDVLRGLRRERGHTFCLDVLGRDSIVVDAGAHTGEFSLGVREKCASRCILVEANPSLASGLAVRFSEVVPAALTASDGTQVFHSRDNMESGSVIPCGEVETARCVSVDAISLPTLMRQFGMDRIDLLKLDIEGSEFDLLAELPEEVAAQVGQLTVEFHDFLPAFARRGLFGKVKRRLEKLGFVCCKMSFRTNGDVLFLNRRFFDLPAPSDLFLSHIARFYQRLREKIVSGTARA